MEQRKREVGQKIVKGLGTAFGYLKRGSQRVINKLKDPEFQYTVKEKTSYALNKTKEKVIIAAVVTKETVTDKEKMKELGNSIKTGISNGYVKVRDSQLGRRVSQKFIDIFNPGHQENEQEEAEPIIQLNEENDEHEETEGQEAQNLAKEEQVPDENDSFIDTDTIHRT